MRKIRLGMVGGGQGAFIGDVHRIAARLDNRYELVAGALSSDPERALNSATELGLNPERSYANYEEMALREAQRDDGVEIVSIVTPNHLHFSAAKAFVEAGIHVICDKPLTTTLEEAETLKELVNKHQVLFAVTYNYSGYPMVRHAKELVSSGALGEIKIIQIQYAQDWLATNIEASGQKQAAWRTDPTKAGAGGSIGDIGTHAFHLAEFISGLTGKSLLADLDSFVGERSLDDNAHILIRYNNGAKGMLWASQVAIGKENGLKIELFGDKAGLSWQQENPNYLELTALGESTQRISRAGPNIGESASAASRIPSGHPEGFLEGFANLYRDIADVLLNDCGLNNSLVPGVSDGLKGMRFIDAAVKSNSENCSWTKL